jgi:hypothetical protein
MNARSGYIVLLLVLSGFAAEPAREHWSLKPLRSVAPPPVENAGWCKTPIDAFILSRLQAERMEPSIPADKRTLIRRAYFDLIGLPPTPAEVEAFLADVSPRAFEVAIDRLLARPEYGERWARHWLDVAHYAETHGHDQDRPRTNAWPYRDYVIQSFNADKPYARFVEEQIAGDGLYPDDPQATVAMGFLATGPWDESSLRDIREDSIDRQIARYIDRDDIVTTVMNTFVSTTVQCARCHDHKFDPVTQREYYNLQAVFAGTEKGNRVYDPDPELHRERQQLLRRQKYLENPSPALRDELLSPEFSAKVATWGNKERKSATAWQVLTPISCSSSNGSVLAIQSDGSIRSGGKRPDCDTYTVVTPARSTATGLRLEVLADDALPKNGPGRQDNGNLHLTDLRLYAIHSDSSMSDVPLRNPIADFNQDGWDIKKAIDDDPQSAWGIFPQVGKSHQAVFEIAGETIDAEQFQFVLAQDHGGGHLIGKLRLAITTADLPLHLNSLPDDIAAILATPHPERTRDQQLALALFFARQEVQRELDSSPSPHLVYAGAHDFVPDASFKPIGKMREVRMLKRGDINMPGDLATPGALSCLAGLNSRFVCDSSEGSRRVALARWITDPQNALTWRSVVNRVWHYHFGRGLVNTPNDFGRMGGQPSHPELLDWLANWFLENGGSFKKLHKLILLSAVYQQSSRDQPAYSARDADNVLLWRMNRARLEAETVRDVILAVSQTMDAKMGGPSAQQFNMSPGIHVTPKVDYASFDFDRAEMRRRSIYRFVFRTLPDPFMDSLDCPDSSQLTAARNTSVTVGQALAMLNDQFITRYSEHFAERLERSDPGNREGQVRLAIELLFNREPRPEELTRFARFVERDGLANFCRVLFNSNEFMFIN